MREEGGGKETRGAYREEVVHGGERRGERGGRAGGRRGERRPGEEVWPLRRRGCLKLRREVGWAGVNAAGAEAGRWATRDLFRQAGWQFLSPFQRCELNCVFSEERERSVVDRNRTVFLCKSSHSRLPVLHK